MRDDFKSNLIKMLAKRVSYRCSNPKCRRPTSGPHTDPAKSINNGVAAHITAAAEGGPRYDPTLAPEERASSTNGIWLCQNCSRIIDSDVPRYPTSLLKRWKERAEEVALLEVNGESVPESLRRERPATWPSYDHPEIFVQRQVTYSFGLSSTRDEAITRSATLIDLISESHVDKPCRIVVQSDAGAGKTTELDFVAHHFSVDPDKLFFPILISLKNYTNQDITALLDHYCRNWKGLEESEILLILDGLDEIKAEEREDFIRKVRSFTDIYTNCNLVLSCRANFSNSVSTQLQGFTAYTLHEFGDQDIEAYVDKRLPGRGEQFMNFIKENRLLQWLRNPFSLTHFVSFYEKDPGTIPQTRIDLLQRVVAFPHLDNDLVRLQAEEERETYRQLVMKLAFAMNLLGVNSLSESQKVELFPSLTDRSRLKAISFLIVTETEIRFKHNILQEYFAAVVLVEQTFEQISTCVTFQPDTEKLKPKWLNTLGILLEMPLSQSAHLGGILDLISEQEPQLLLSIEYSHFGQSLRTQIFKSILEHSDRRYSRSLLYDSRLAELADITGNPDIIDYLLEMIPSEDIWLRNEGLYYLRQADPHYLFGYESQIKDTLKQVLLQAESGVYGQKRAIAVLIKLNLFSPEFDRLLTESIPNIDDADLRDEIYRYLIQTDKIDAYIDFMLDGFNAYQTYREKETTRLAGLGHGFRAGLEQIKTPAGLGKLVDFLIANVSFVKDYNEVFDHFQSDTSSFSVFADRLAKAYEVDGSLYHKVLTLYKTLGKHHRRPYAQDLISFFRLTHTDRLSFYALLESEEDDHWIYIIGWLTSEEILADYLSQIQADKVDTKQVWSIIHSLNVTRQHELADQFREKASSNSGKVFEHDTSWITKEVVRRQNDLALLLDQQTFIQIVNDIFDYYQVNALTQNQVWEYKYENDEDNNEIVSQYLSSWFIDSRRQMINRDESVDFLRETDNWEYYTVEELVILQENNQELSPAHIDKIQHWAIAKFAEADFSSAIIESSSDSWSYRPLERLLARIYLGFQLSLSAESLLAMLSFDDNGLATARVLKGKDSLTLSEKIIQEVGLELVKERVLQNLENGIKIKLVLSNHIALCGKLNIQQAVPILKSILVGDYGVSVPDHELARSLDVYIDLGGKLNELTFIFNQFDPTQEFSWTLLEHFSEAGLFHQRISKLLLQKAEEGLIDRTSPQLMRQLVDVGNIEGLRLFVSYIKSTNKLPGQYSQLGNVGKLPGKEASELLLDLLLYSIGNDIRGDSFHEAIEIIMMFLKDVALGSDATYSYVADRLAEVVDTHTNHPKHHFLKSSLLFLEKEYYLQKTDYRTVAEIKPVVEAYLH